MRPAMYGEELRRLFPDLRPSVEDLFLLEAHQVAELRARAPSRELAAILHAHPLLRTYLARRHPPSAEPLGQLLEWHGPLSGTDLAAATELVLWELADEIVYQRAPEAYDKLARRDWRPDAVTSLADPEGVTVVDAGAGTGVVAFSLLAAHVVFAVEPVARLRAFMRERARSLGVTNLYALDGMLDAIPLPNDSADILVTNRAIGWRPDEEEAEIERVLRPDGLAVHVIAPVTAVEADGRLLSCLRAAGYQVDVQGEGDLARWRAWRRGRSGRVVA